MPSRRRSSSSARASPGARRPRRCATRGYDGRLVLVGEEAELPVRAAAAVEGVPAAASARSSSSLVRTRAFWAERDVELRLGTPAARIDPADARCRARRRPASLLRRAARRDRRPHRGCVSRALSFPAILDLRSDRGFGAHRRGRRRGRAGGRRRHGLHRLRGRRLAPSPRSRRGRRRAVRRPARARRSGMEIGRVIAEIHRDHGVGRHLGEGVAAFEGAARVERVVTSSGERIECDFAVVGVGIEPAVDVVAGTGIEVDNGDRRRRALPRRASRASMRPATWPTPCAPALRAGACRALAERDRAGRRRGARSMLGKGEPYAELHWFWSDQYDANIQYTGHHTGGDELVVRGSLDERKFVAFYLDGRASFAAAALRPAAATCDGRSGLISRRSCRRSGGAARPRDRPADARAGRLSRRRRQAERAGRDPAPTGDARRALWRRRASRGSRESPRATPTKIGVSRSV